MKKSARVRRAYPRVTVSVIIPVAPLATARPAFSSLNRDRYRNIEIIRVQGGQPARQRNLAGHRARGRYLYFLDHDSHVESGAIRKLVDAFADGTVGAAGGPNPGLRLNTQFKLASELVLGSRLGSLTVWRRYVSGKEAAREVGEESLILCNLMIRRDLFLELGGFDPRLYPNEENEFLNRLRASGKRAIYIPGAVVRKPRAAGLFEFIRENFRYARGRMEQVWINPSLHDAPYLSALAGIGLAAWAAVAAPWLVRLAAVIYAAAVVAENLRLVARASSPAATRRGPGLALLAAGLMALRHVTYAAGLIYGMFSGWRKRKVALRPDYFRLSRHIMTPSGFSSGSDILEPVGSPEVRVPAGAA